MIRESLEDANLEGEVQQEFKNENPLTFAEQTKIDIC